MPTEIISALPTDSVLAETMTDLAGKGLTVAQLDRAAFIRYRKHLQDTYAKSTASRMVTIARRPLAEAVKHSVPSSSTFSIKKANITANHAYGMTAAGVAATSRRTPARSP